LRALALALFALCAGGCFDFAALGTGACPDHVLACDTFESGALDNQVWSGTFQVNATIAVDGTHAHRGFYAAHVQSSAVTAAQGVHAELDERKSFAGMPRTTAIRAFVYLPSANLPVLTRLLNYVLPLPPYPGVFLDLDHGSLVLENEVPGGLSSHSTVQMPLDRWACLELRVDNVGQVTTLLDDVSLAALTVTTPTVSLPPEDQVGFDLEIYNTDVPAYEMWWDDLVVDDKPIGCSK
jgi:hypothetical protein